MPRALANADALGPQLDNTLHPDIVQLVWNELANLIENPEVGEIIWDGPDEIDAIHHLPGDLSAIRISYSYTPEGNYMWVHAVTIDVPRST